MILAGRISPSAYSRQRPADELMSSRLIKNNPVTIRANNYQDILNVKHLKKMKDFEKQYKALANRRRLVILKYLKSRTKASVGDIAKEIKLQLKSTSKHLRVLSAVDFVESQQQSLHVFYFLPQMKPAVLKNFLDIL